MGDYATTADGRDAAVRDRAHTFMVSTLGTGKSASVVDTHWPVGPLATNSASTVASLYA